MLTNSQIEENATGMNITADDMENVYKSPVSKSFTRTGSQDNLTLIIPNSNSKSPLIQTRYSNLR